VIDRDDPNRELVARLSTMRWPEPSPDARRRVWESVMRELAELVERSDGVPAFPEALREGSACSERSVRRRLGERRMRRHEFAKPPGAGGGGGGYSGALGARVAAVQGASRPQFA
jgi:hypothetical protein